MKKISFLIGLGLILISACMIYLVRSGISLRTAPLIKPTEISVDQRNVAEHLVLRLFPEFQSSEIVVWGVLPQTDSSQLLIANAEAEFQKMFKMPVNFIADGENATLQQLSECHKPCWILVHQKSANELMPGSFSEKYIQPLNRPYFSLTLIPFTHEMGVTDQCEHQQRLHLDCLVPLSIRDAQKKMKDPNKLYFFLRKYNDRDYFLFTQTK